MKNEALLVENIISAFENMKKTAELKLEIQRLSKELASRKEVFDPMLCNLERAVCTIPDALEYILNKTEGECDKDCIEQILTSFDGDVRAVCTCILDDNKEVFDTDPEIFDINLSRLKTLKDKTTVSEYAIHCGEEENRMNNQTFDLL